MSRTMIKYIAVITMTLNHIANVVTELSPLLREVMLDIGYFTAVTMCYFLVEGYQHTHSKKKYAQRLFVFALISQIPYQIALERLALNMMFTLFICFLILAVKEYVRQPAMKALAITVLILCTWYSDWGLTAPVFTLLFAWSGENRKKTALAYGAALLLFCGRNFYTFYMYAYQYIGREALGYALPRALGTSVGILASGTVILFLYNREKSPGSGKFGKWFFYVYYPVHLAALALLRMII